MAFITRKATGTAAITALLALSTGAEADSDKNSKMQDGKWVSVSGVVVSFLNDDFVLDHGDGLIIIEMDDWMGAEDIGNVGLGNRVEVTGEVDHDFMERRKIEAASVYSEANNTHSYASPVDEEAGVGVNRTVTFTSYSLPESSIPVAGEIVGIEGRELTVDVGECEITVETASMPYNPVDDTGFPQFGTGDMIQAAGTLNESFFSGDGLEAERVTLMSDRSGAR